MQRRLPRRQEVQAVANKLREDSFLDLTSFSDALLRFNEIMFSNEASFTRLKWGVAYLLTIRGGSLTPTDLCKLLIRGQHSITKLVDSLEKDGFVIRSGSKKDRRVVNLKLTSAGLNWIERTHQDSSKVVKGIMSCLDDGETEALIRLVHKLRRAVLENIRK